MMTAYILKLMAHPPHAAEPELEEAPIRTAGITPAASVGHDQDEGSN